MRVFRLQRYQALKASVTVAHSIVEDGDLREDFKVLPPLLAADERNQVGLAAAGFAWAI
jgi:hypothetical protein